MKSVTVRQMESFLKTLKSSFGWFPDLLIVDYMDIVRPYGRNKEKHECLEEISEELKALAQRNKIPVWTASQSNRAGSRKKTIENEDAAGSYAKLFPADVVLSMSPERGEDGIWRGNLKVIKNRLGSTGQSLRFTCDFDHMRFIHEPDIEENKSILKKPNLIDKYREINKRLA